MVLARSRKTTMMGTKHRQKTKVTPMLIVSFITACLLTSIGINFYFVGNAPHHNEDEPPTRLMTPTTNNYSDENNKPLKILHIVTSLAEYESGKRNTDAGADRLQNKLLPVLKKFLDSVYDHPHMTVDVYMIFGFNTTRRHLIEQALPEGVGLEIWQDAMPFYYPPREDKIVLATHALARQHRFVIKDKFEEYDFFSCWEDDMQITAKHIEHFVEMSKEIENLRKKAAAVSEKVEKDDYVFLTEAQLRRAIPGYIRVEVLSDDDQKPLKHEPIEPDTSFKIDPHLCCSSSKEDSELSSEKVAMWETAIKGFGVRQFPGKIGWVGLMSAIVDPRIKHSNIDMYWSGAGGAFGKDAQHPARHPHYMAQQGGWMATKEQIKYFDSVCPGGFLPPFDGEMWAGNSGLKPQNVEFWSGGYQLFGRCFLQRIISLDPDKFSLHLLHHTSNNKQYQLGMQRFSTADELLGQLQTVKKMAIEIRGDKK